MKTKKYILLTTLFLLPLITNVLNGKRLSVSTANETVSLLGKDYQSSEIQKFIKPFGKPTSVENFTAIDKLYALAMEANEVKSYYWYDKGIKMFFETTYKGDKLTSVTFLRSQGRWNTFADKLPHGINWKDSGDEIERALKGKVMQRSDSTLVLLFESPVKHKLILNFSEAGRRNPLRITITIIKEKLPEFSLNESSSFNEIYKAIISDIPNKFIRFKGIKNRKKMAYVSNFDTPQFGTIQLPFLSPYLEIIAYEGGNFEEAYALLKKHMEEFVQCGTEDFDHSYSTYAISQEEDDFETLVIAENSEFPYEVSFRYQNIWDDNIDDYQHYITVTFNRSPKEE